MTDIEGTRLWCRDGLAGRKASQRELTDGARRRHRVRIHACELEPLGQVWIRREAVACPVPRFCIRECEREGRHHRGLAHGAPLILLAHVACGVDLAHARIQASHDALCAVDSKCFVGEGFERRDAHHRPIDRECKALRNSARDADPGERTRARAKRNAIERLQREARFRERTRDDRQDAARIVLRHTLGMQMPFVAVAHGHGDPVGRRIECEETHATDCTVRPGEFALSDPKTAPRARLTSSARRV